MKIKPKKPSAIEAGRIRKEIARLRDETDVMKAVSAMHDIPDSLRKTIQEMADSIGVPVEAYAPLYSGFWCVLYRMRITILEAQLHPERLN